MQILRHDVQLVFAQFRQQVLSQDQAVHRGVVEGNPIFPASRSNKAISKSALWAARGRSPAKARKAPAPPSERGPSSISSVMPVRWMISGLRMRPGGHKGVEAVGDLPVFQHHRADLDDDLVLFIQAGGLDVKADDLIRKEGVRLSMDHHPVVHIVDVIGLHTEEHLDLLGRVLGVGKGVGHA